MVETARGKAAERGLDCLETESGWKGMTRTSFSRTSTQLMFGKWIISVSPRAGMSMPYGHLSLYAPHQRLLTSGSNVASEMAPFGRVIMRDPATRPLAAAVLMVGMRD